MGAALRKPHAVLPTASNDNFKSGLRLSERSVSTGSTTKRVCLTAPTKRRPGRSLSHDMLVERTALVTRFAADTHGSPEIMPPDREIVPRRPSVQPHSASEVFHVALGPSSAGNPIILATIVSGADGSAGNSPIGA